MSSEASDPAPVEGAPVEKTEKQLKREAEKKAKKLAARQVRGQPGGAITVGAVQNPPVELEPPSGTRVREYMIVMDTSTKQLNHRNTS